MIEDREGIGRTGALLSAHEHGGALLPDGRLESELSLGHAEPFGPNPNGQFHRARKKACKKKSLQTKQRKRGGGGSGSENHLSHATSSALKVLWWLLSPLQRSMG